MDRRTGFPQTWQEARRKRAFELKQHVWKQCEIAEALGVSPAAVSQWLANMREYGMGAWRAKPRLTGPIKLAGDQVRLTPELLSHGAEAYGFRGECWTCARVATVLGEKFGVWYHKALSRLLTCLHWTPQMPIERATQRDEAVIEQWRLRVWPQLKKSARRRPDHRVCGRVGVLSLARPRPNVCTLRTDTSPVLAIYTRSGVGDERDHDGRPTRHDGTR
jgi:transposase